MWHVCVKREILVYTGFGGKKTVGKRQLGRLRRRREDYVRMDAMVTGGLWKGMNWIDLAQDTDRCWAVVNTVMNIQVPQNEENFLTS
jgi:hypothetical protein